MTATITYTKGQFQQERPSDNMTFHASTIQAILKDLKGEA